MRLPSTNPVTLRYGATSPPYTSANPHAGTDYGNSPDIYSYTPERVKVTLVNSGTDCGNLLDVESLDGKRKYRYCHSEKIYAITGQTYNEGYKIAKMGQTGLAYGVHLHFVMWVNGVRVDPDKTIKLMMEESVAKITKQIEDRCFKLSKNTVPNQDTYKYPWAKLECTPDNVTAMLLEHLNRSRTVGLIAENEGLKAELASGYVPVTEPLFKKNKP